MRLLTLDFSSDVPAYRQISSELRGLIARGELHSGDALPSVRELGRQLGVNLNTVAKAYRILVEEGLIELRHGSGARVTSRTESPPPETRTSALAVREVIGWWASRGLPRTEIEKRLRALLDDVLPEGPKLRRRTSQ